MLISLIRSGLEPQMIIFMVIIYVFAMTLSFSVHEFMHASTAVWLGDPTPRNMGRLTLNPLAHLDPVGTILLLVAGFGWGKPVMYNPRNLRRFKSYRGMNIMVHLAGVTGNFIVALVFSIFLGIILGLSLKYTHVAITALALVCSYTVSFSLMLLAFNLLPIPPLDGFHVLEELLPYKVKSSEGYMQFQRYSPMVIWVIFMVSSFGNIRILNVVMEIIEFPFRFVCTLLMTLFEYLISLLLAL